MTRKLHKRPVGVMLLWESMHHNYDNTALHGQAKHDNDLLTLAGRMEERAWAESQHVLDDILNKEAVACGMARPLTEPSKVPR